MSVPLSILDLAPISDGSDAATALRNTVDLAQHAEQWGYQALSGSPSITSSPSPARRPRC